MFFWAIILLTLICAALSFITRINNNNRNSYILRDQAKSKGGKVAVPKNEESNAFDKQLNNLKFSYEYRSSNNTKKIPRSYFVYQGKPSEASIVCGSPKQIPMRGCNMDDTYLSASSPNDEDIKLNTLRIEKTAWKQLPCIEDGTCPHVRFQCGKCKHEWKALAGSPVSLQCPKCSTAKKKSLPQKRKSSTLGKIANMKKRSLALYRKLSDHATSKGELSSSLTLCLC